MSEKITSFEDLKIFRRATTLCEKVYKFTNTEPWKNDYRFVQQIRAAAGSIMDNIAEGFERDGNKEFIQFLYIAKGSCGEVRSQVIRAYKVQFITKEIYDELYADCLSLSKSIAAFIQTLKSSEVQGVKHL